MRIRSWSNLFETAKIKDYVASDGEVVLEDAITCAGQPFLPLWGYYLDNVLEELDSPREWYFDTEKNKVYLWAPDHADPNNLLVEGSTYQTGIKIYWKDHHTTIENLTFRHQTESGIVVNTSDTVTIKNNKFAYCEEQGIYIWNAKDLTLSENIFENMLNIAIYSKSGWDDASLELPFDPGETVIEKNIIRNTGMVPGYGKTKGGNVTAIKLESKGMGVLVRQNTIENTGSCGITVGGGGHTLENNVIRGSMLLLDDGGGIQVESGNNLIKGNFILETFGNRDESSGYARFDNGEGSFFRVMGMGIGSGKGHKGNVIEGNTIADNRDWGIRVNQWHNTTIKGNVFYNNGTQVVFEGDEEASELAYHNIFEGNVLYSLSWDQDGMVLDGPDDYGTFRNNYYCNPYSDIVIQRDGKRYSLAKWQKTFPLYDSHSKTSLIRLDAYSLSGHGPDLIINSEFTSDIDEWSESGYVISHDLEKAGMDNGSIKVEYEEDNPHLKPNAFEVAQAQYYLLRFSMAADHPGIVSVTFSDQTTDPWELIAKKCFAVDETPKTNTFVFQSDRATSETTPRFSSDSSDPDAFWLDNVSFQAVDAILNDPKTSSILFSNFGQYPRTIDLEETVYHDLDGKVVQDIITLEPYASEILTYVSGPSDPEPPTITSFAPESGEQGDEITITGTNFTDVTSVKFNGIEAADHTVDSEQGIIIAIVPQGAVTGPVRVTTLAGYADSASDFMLRISPKPPTISGFEPISGSAGDMVTITGTNLANVISVTFGGIKAAQFTILSGTGLTAVVPQDAITGQISVATSESGANSTSDFEVTLPPPDGDYYLSSSEGDDANHGTRPETPWKTLNRLNQALKANDIQPGDKILFRRGDIFTGRVDASGANGQADHPIVYGAYGDPLDPRPIIRGTVEIAGWRPYETDGGIACATDISGLMESLTEKGSTGASDIEDVIAEEYQARPQYLFLDDQAQRLARHPNEGFFFIDETSGTNSKTIHDTELIGIPQTIDWKGGHIVVRTSSRTYAHFEIESTDRGALTVAGDEPVTDESGMAINNGYFLQGRQGLDAPGEWCLDEADETLFFVPPEGMSCSDLDNRITVSVFENAMTLDDHVSVENIQFEGYGSAVFDMASLTEYGVIDNCVIRNSRQGVKGTSIRDSTLSNNTFQDIFDSAISFWGDISHLTISGNTFENIGLYPGTEGGYVAVSLGSDKPETGRGNVISKNHIDTVGYAGIMVQIGDPSGESPTIIEKNVVRHAMTILADGASIHLQNAQGNIIRDNILTHAIGNKESWNAGMGDKEYTAEVFGIADYGTNMRNNQYVHNTVTHHDKGFRGGLGAKNTVLKENVFFANQVCQAEFSMGDEIEASLGYDVQHNVFYCTDPFQWVMRQNTTPDDHHWEFGHFDNNYYCNPYSVNRYAGRYLQDPEYSGVMIWRRQSSDAPYNYFLDLDEYQAVSGEDANTKTDLEKWTVFRIGDRLYEVDEIQSNNYMSNSDFESGITPWEVSGGKVALDTREELDGNCLKVMAGDGYYVSINNGESIPFDPEAHYLLSFSGLRDVSLPIDVAAYHRFDQYSGKPMISDKHSFPIGPGRHDYAYIFKIDATQGTDAQGNIIQYDMRIFFHIEKDEPEYWLDNVRLHKVSLRQAVPREERSKIFVNDTDADKTFPLGSVSYRDLDGNWVTGDPVVLPPYSSKILTFGSVSDQRSLADVIRVLQVLVGFHPDGIHWIPDVNADAGMGLAEAIHMLQQVSGEWEVGN